MIMTGSCIFIRTFICLLLSTPITMKQSILLLLLSGILLAAAAACNTTKQQHHNQHAMPDIHGKRWILARFTDTVFSRPEKQIYLLFEKDNLRVTGFAGCNGFRGTYLEQGHSLEIGPVAATKMWCNHALTEQYFLRVLERANTYRASEDSLLLMLEDYPLASFYPDPIP